MKPLRAAVVLAAVLALAAGLSGRASALSPDQGSPGAVDVEQCKSCHDQAVAGMQGSRHAGLEKSCASCHGDTTEHLKSNLEKGEPGPIIKLTTMKADEVTKACLQCHDSGHQANFAGGVHDRRGVSCTGCHSVHAFKSVKAQLKTARDAETCYTCHTNIRNKQMRPSHHPVREGLMTCSSCHDAHDATKPKMVAANWSNEKCLECHTEKRGPFLWEHAPVRENCMNCHDPHGSNHEKLLQAKQPYLCQRCHLNTRHPGTLYDGRNTTTVIAQASNRAVEHSCRNCHQNIHGGNAPSGPYLGR